MIYCFWGQAVCRQLKTALTGSYLSTAEAFIWPLVLTWTSGISDTVTVGKPTGHWLWTSNANVTDSSNTGIRLFKPQLTPIHPEMDILSSFTPVCYYFFCWTPKGDILWYFSIQKQLIMSSLPLFTHLHIVPIPYDFLSSSKGQIELHDFSLREWCQAKKKKKEKIQKDQSGISFDLHLISYFLLLSLFDAIVCVL